MARYFSRHSGRRIGRTRRWTYAILTLVIIAAVIAVILRYRPFGKGGPRRFASQNRSSGGVALIDTGVGSGAELPVPSLLEIIPELTVEPNPKVAGLIAEAGALINDKPSKVIAARDILNEALPMAMSEQQRAVVRQRLSELADKWLFSRRIFPQDKLCGSLRVNPGERLSTIGKQRKVPYELLMEINGISWPEALQAGEPIKVINGPFHARVYRSTFTMDLYLQNTFVRSFPVGLGRPGMETPTGLWRVKSDGKLISPTWTDPITGKTYEAEDPDYPLGSRWIGLEGIGGDAKGRTGFAIHGTKDPGQIGIAGSQGCIRLHNGNAILLYNLLVPVHSLVEVVE